MNDKQTVNYDGHYYDWYTIVGYMDDDIREKLHFELAPCSNETFLERYLEIVPSYQNLIKNELYPMEKYSLQGTTQGRYLT